MEQNEFCIGDKREFFVRVLLTKAPSDECGSSQYNEIDLMNSEEKLSNRVISAHSRYLVEYLNIFVILRNSITVLRP